MRVDRTAIMQGFPPRPEAQADLSNWRKPPFNRWAFKHVREIIPTAEIANDPERVRPLHNAVRDLSGLSIVSAGERLDLAAVLHRTETDGLVVLSGDRILFEYYSEDMDPFTPHILMSVSKSVCGLLAGVLHDRGLLPLDEPLTRWVPEIARTAYAGATARDLLDMRAGILFDEDYMAVSGRIIEYRKAQGWDPIASGETPSDLRSFLTSLADGDGPHSGRFHYVSPNTDLMGWVLERASGRRYADLASECLWRPMGAERSGYITVDRLGAPRSAGGQCATVRDLARLGLLIAEGGMYAGRQIVPSTWIRDILTDGDAAAWQSGDFAADLSGRPMHYRNYWYVLRGPSPVIFGVGVFGQHLFVSPAEKLVVAKVSSQPLPLDWSKVRLTLDAVDAIRASL
jgi:CubicO group peptidase (beta-lactamase class C family)